MSEITKRIKDIFEDARTNDKLDKWECKCGESLYEKRAIESVSYIKDGSDEGAPFDSINRYIRGGNRSYCCSCGKDVTKEIESKSWSK